MESVARFLSVAAHELRTPLSSVIGFCDILIAGRAGEMTGRQPEFLRVVRQAAEQMDGLVDDLVDVASSLRGDLTLERGQVDLPLLVTSVAGDLEPMLAGSGVRLINRVDRSVGEVESDARRLKRVLTNLVGYAVKSSEGGLVSVLAQRRRREVVVRIGFGDTEMMEGSDGDPDATRSEVAVGCQKGSGLALLTARYILEAHGGRFWTERKSGRCSAFIFTLPLHPS